jgi:hypothetical protein
MNQEATAKKYEKQFNAGLRDYRYMADRYLAEGKKKAHDHAKEYIEIFEKNPLLPHTRGVELCNVCNLKCLNCPTPTTGYPRGFATDDIVRLAIKYSAPGDYFALHGLGEPLLHKDFLKHLRLAAEFGFHVCVSTNGLLLTEELGREIIESGFAGVFYISFHHPDSVEAFRVFLRLYKEYGCDFNYHGQILSHNREDALEWMKETGVGAEDAALFVRDVDSHSWAGNLVNRRRRYEMSAVEKRVGKCIFINNNEVSVRYDGSVTACCMDSENRAQLGDIHNFENIQQNPEGYELCEYCDPSWVNGNI